MATMYSLERRLRETTIPELHNGDHLNQKEFHRRYEAMPENVRAELIGGVVYMSSPLKRKHGTHHFKLGGALWLYEEATPGVEAADNTTTILGEDAEVQPDLNLRLLSAVGGQTTVSDKDYIVGAPEWLAEVAHSSEDIDLYRKKDDYRRAGVLEYLVLCLREKQIRWMLLQENDVLKPDAKGIYRSQVFPGLWIDGPALIEKDSTQLKKVMMRGIRSPEHARFVKELQARRRKRS
jgi:Uma2 family endonuclease